MEDGEPVILPLSLSFGSHALLHFLSGEDGKKMKEGKRERGRQRRQICPIFSHFLRCKEQYTYDVSAKIVA